MAGTRAAIRYAKAVLSLATDNKNAEAVQLDMALISSSIANSRFCKTGRMSYNI